MPDVKFNDNEYRMPLTTMFMAMQEKGLEFGKDYGFSYKAIILRACVQLKAYIKRQLRLPLILFAKTYQPPNHCRIISMYDANSLAGGKGPAYIDWEAINWAWFMSLCMGNRVNCFPEIIPDTLPVASKSFGVSLEASIQIGNVKHKLTGNIKNRSETLPKRGKQIIESVFIFFHKLNIGSYLKKIKCYFSGLDLRGLPGSDAFCSSCESNFNFSKRYRASLLIEPPCSEIKTDSKMTINSSLTLLRFAIADCSKRFIKSGGSLYPTLTRVSPSLFAFICIISALWKKYSITLLTNYFNTSIMEV